MGLRDLLAADAAAFTNPDDLGESVTYYDVGDEIGREINVLVFREEPDIGNAQTSTSRTHAASMFVTADPTTGVARPTLRDRVLVSLRHGDDAVRCRVMNVGSGDSGGWLLTIGK